MKLAARINGCGQISPDSFEGVCHIKEVTDQTTIRDLIEWQKRIFLNNTDIQSEKDFFQTHLSIME